MSQTEARRMAEEAYEHHYKCDANDPSQAERLDVWYNAFAAALVKLTQQEPVGEVYDVCDGLGSKSVMWLTSVADIPAGIKLYTHPAPSQQEERKPLTDEQFIELWPGNPGEGLRALLLAFKAKLDAHNIKEQQ